MSDKDLIDKEFTFEDYDPDEIVKGVKLKPNSLAIMNGDIYSQYKHTRFISIAEGSMSFFMKVIFRGDKATQNELEDRLAAVANHYKASDTWLSKFLLLLALDVIEDVIQSHDHTFVSPVEYRLKLLQKSDTKEKRAKKLKRYIGTDYTYEQWAEDCTNSGLDPEKVGTSDYKVGTSDYDVQSPTIRIRQWLKITLTNEPIEIDTLKKLMIEANVIDSEAEWSNVSKIASEAGYSSHGGRGHWAKG